MAYQRLNLIRFRFWPRGLHGSPVRRDALLADSMVDWKLAHMAMFFAAGFSASHLGRSAARSFLFVDGRFLMEIRTRLDLEIRAAKCALSRSTFRLDIVGLPYRNINDHVKH
jgi:hypothetical protein